MYRYIVRLEVNAAATRLTAAASFIDPTCVQVALGGLAAVARTGVYVESPTLKVSSLDAAVVGGRAVARPVCDGCRRAACGATRSAAHLAAGGVGGRSAFIQRVARCLSLPATSL